MLHRLVVIVNCTQLEAIAVPNHEVPITNVQPNQSIRVAQDLANIPMQHMMMIRIQRH